VKGDKNTCKEDLVFFLERQRKAVDDGSENFEELGDAVMTLALIDELKKDVVDGATDKGAQIEEFAIDAVKGGLQKVTLAWVFRVKELEEVEDKRLIDVSLCEVGVEIWALHKAQEEFVDNLEMRPGQLEDWFVFLWIESIAGWVDGRGY
jgi:hypothetical protein